MDTNLCNYYTFSKDNPIFFRFDVLAVIQNPLLAFMNATGRAGHEAGHGPWKSTKKQKD